MTTDQAAPDWRGRAILAFPELRDELEDLDEIFSIYDVFSELLPMVRSAHRKDDEEALRRIYGYAAWASGQDDRDAWNAAGVSFYEHLFDERWMRPLVIGWLDTRIVRDHIGLWELMLSESDFAEVQELLYRGKLLHLKGRKRKRRR